MFSPGTVLEVSIEKPAAGGRMIARHEGRVLLVHAAVPGERVRAVVERTSQGVIYATAIDVMDASPDRRVGLRDWACGGNVYSHIAYPRQLTLKGEVVADALSRIGKITPEAPIAVTPSPEEGYRMRARLHARGRMLGYFREGTHGLCDPTTTRQLLPETCELVRDLAERMRDGALEGVTEIEIAENVPATERALHLELNAPRAPRGLAAIAALPSVKGASASFAAMAPDRSGRVRRTMTAGGEPCVADSLELERPGATPVQVALRHHVHAFYQGNRYLLARLASRVVSLVPEGPVVDLYAGVGLFSASLAASGWKEVIAVEGDRAGAADLKTNAAPFGSALEPVEMAVEAYLSARPVAPGAAIVIDPPRTGMSKEASAAVAAQKAARLIYVSCDVATFARDARKLVDAGYRLEHIEAFDMFPNTAHVEVVAAFGRI